MANKAARSGAPSTKSTTKKKPRHTAAQKKVSRAAREQAQQRAGSSHSSGASGSRAGKSPRWSEETRIARGRRPSRRRPSDMSGEERTSQERTGHRQPRSEHSFRSHREERAGRPDSSDRAPDRRPSSRERAEHEAHRAAPWERSTPRRDQRDTEQRRSGERRFEEPRVDRRFEEPRVDRAASRGEADREGLSGVKRPAAAPVTDDNGFAALGLHPDLVAALARQGIVAPFPIQSATIPDALAGRDLLGRGQTGSGKTMAFGLPTLHRLVQLPRARPHRPHAIVLTPTRELASQIVDALRPLMSALRLRHQLIAGGMSYTPQLRSLDEGVDVLVATPGRLWDLIERGAADLSEVHVTVLDEADHMAQMGFVEAISQILDLTPSGGQRLLFSATLDHGVDKVAKRYLEDPVTHSTDSATASVTTMDHHVFLVHPHDKKSVTATIANRSGRTLVFVRTKLGCDRVALQLRESGVFAAALHGGLNQAQRTRVLEAFRTGEIPVLVATDVAARGIHVDDVSLVLQVDPPADHKDYLHRSGRTARAGEDGVVVTLALPHQRRQVGRMLDSAGVQARPVDAGPDDRAVLATAGGRVPSGEAIPQSRLDAVLRPPRRAGSRPGGRAGRPGDRRGGYRGNSSAGRRESAGRGARSGSR